MQVKKVVLAGRFGCHLVRHVADHLTDHVREAA